MQKISYLFAGALIVSNCSLFCSDVEQPNHSTLEFIKNAVWNISTVGAIAPFSEITAQEITNHIQKYAQGKSKNYTLRVLELGAGTGTLSKHILNTLQQTDHPYTLDLVEIMPEYCKLLEKQFSFCDGVKVHQADAKKFKPTHKVDVVISTLPFNALDFDLELVKGIFKNIESVTLPNGRFIWVQYFLLPTLMRYVLWGDLHKKFIEKEEFKEKFKEKHGFKEGWVMRNLPPTRVYEQTLSNNSIR